MLISLYAILKKDKAIEEMRKEVTLYVTKLEKLGAKKDTTKGSKKEIATIKSLNSK